ncbi:MAG: aminotransferase class III-fold pyridoxal phosphate-dependent enzyme [Planctomycetes bacterium]|nr:aminotransferase class III-fold pyridoxal phosphate-dependent enzyme [Planctomycetota bacterium]MBL7038955.1 aminotransferase class III-fold pyridoxal phosphate-dependent enzyme [Pirellulaceae bacterium]
MALGVTSLEPIPTAAIQTRWRHIVTPIPAPESVSLIERLRQAEPRSMATMPPILWHEAEGFLVRDPFGNQWIDFTSGIVLANAGHAHPRIVQAIREATEQRLLATYAFPSESRLALLEKLVALSPIPDSKAILYSSGTEATECALMLMRRHGQRIRADKVSILSLAGNYHGRTLSAQLASGTPQPTDWIDRELVHHFQIPAPNCFECPWGRSHYEQCGADCFRAGLDKLASRGIDLDRIAGIILEPVPGWTTLPIPRDFAAAASSWAKQHDCLLALDEIQCGCGRTGRFFGGEHLGVTPDLIVLGKGLSSSLPVSAVIGRNELMDLPLPGEMSSTHGGNPVCAAAALANLRVLEDEGLVDASARTGTIVLERLQSLEREFPEHVRAVQGIGLFLSIHLHRRGTAKPAVELADAVAQEAVRRGVLMFTTGRGYLKVTPPLCIEPDAALEAADVIRDCLADTTKTV